jgi:LPS-assembly protein
MDLSTLLVALKKNIIVGAVAAALASAYIPSLSAENKHTLDWVSFDELTETQREALTPGSCGAYIAPLRTDADAALSPKAAAIKAEAKQSTLFGEQGEQQVILIGDVIVRQGYRQIQAQRATLDQAQGTLIMEGDLELREPGLLVLGDSTTVNQDNNTLNIDNATYVLSEQSLRGKADSVLKTDDDRLLLDRASFTTCAPNSNTWYLKGSQIILNRETSQGHAKHVRLYVKGIPVFYFPYLRFPIGSERLSGFLSPTFAFGDQGYEIALPYYFNLAPHYDLILTPYFLEQHGQLYEGNFRHLHQNFSSSINVAYLEKDKGKLDDSDSALIASGTLTEAEAVPFKGEDRWLVNFEQSGGLGKAWSTSIDYTKVSDIDFFRDFSTNVSADDDDNFLDQKISATYDFKHWQLGIAANAYQALSLSVEEPYEELPSLKANGSYSFNESVDRYWSLEMEHELTRFDHPDETSTIPPVTGDRLNASYHLGWNFEPEWGFLRPAIQAKTLQYRLESDFFTQSADQSPDITTPQFKLDAGLFFERNGKGYLQTFEPRLFYFYSDFKDHSSLFDLTTDGQDIDFDTSELTFTYSQLFRDTRFSGGDRIDDANQLSIGLTTRFYGNTSGREWFSASLGQITYFEDRQVSLSNAPETQERSAIAAQLSTNPSEYWRLSSDLLYDEDLGKISRANVKARYQSQQKHIFALNYRYTRDSLEQVDASVIMPLVNDRWHLLLYGAYDVERERELESVAGLEYNGCCYRLRLGYRSKLDEALIKSAPDAELNYDYSSFFEIQFKGLGGTGKRLDSLLEENIDGYTEWQAIYHN